LGRYTREVLDSVDRQRLSVRVFSMGERPIGRMTELVDLGRRTVSLGFKAVDLFHASHIFGVAVAPRCASVTTILDLAPLDIATYRRTGMKYELFYRLAARADAVLTLSSFSADRITDRLGVPPERIFVAPLPARAEFREVPVDGQADWSGPPLPEPYFAAMADLESHDPRKRIEWLPAIAAALVPAGHTLVVAGPGTEQLRAGNLVGVGRVPDRHLAHLFRQAHALVSTTAYEGQGLPPLEAMATGTPVVAMANTAITDLVGDAGVLVEETCDGPIAAAGPHAPSDDGCRRLAEACASLARDHERTASLAARCVHASARFSTDRFDAQLLAAYTAARSRRA
jgi:glycosyltransferase involved in cell wall biosynthesis